LYDKADSKLYLTVG